jgi:hypothetical protein
MIPFILAAVGGYLIGGSTKEIFEEGGVMDDGGIMAKGGALKYKREKFKPIKIAEGEVMLRPDYKAGNYNYIKITKIDKGYAKFDIVDTFNGRTNTIKQDAGVFPLSYLQDFKDSRDKEKHEKEEDIKEKVHNISKKIGVDKLKGGNPASNVIELKNVLTKLSESFKNAESYTTGATAGWSGTMRASVSGQAIKVETNNIHRGGYYEGSTPFLIQIQIGGALSSEERKVASEICKKILSKYEFKVSGFSDTYVRETDGTNWSSVMLTAPAKADTYITQTGLSILENIRS